MGRGFRVWSAQGLPRSEMRLSRCRFKRIPGPGDPHSGYGSCPFRVRVILVPGTGRVHSGYGSCSFRVRVMLVPGTGRARSGSGSSSFRVRVVAFPGTGRVRSAYGSCSFRMLGAAQRTLSLLFAARAAPPERNGPCGAMPQGPPCYHPPIARSTSPPSSPAARRSHRACRSKCRVRARWYPSRS